MKFIYMFSMQCAWVTVKFTKIGAMKEAPS